MPDDQLLAFVVVAVVMSISPGPDMALVLRNTVRGGRGAGFRTVAGIALGLVGWATASALAKPTILAALFIAIGLTWLCTYTLVIDVVARSRALRRVTEAVSGVVLVGLGVRLAVER